MASSDVSVGEAATAVQYNALRAEVIANAASVGTHNSNVTNTHGRSGGLLPIGQMPLNTRQLSGTFTNDTSNGTQTISGLAIAPLFLIVGTAEAGISMCFYDGTRQVAIIKFGGVLTLKSGTQTLQPYTGAGDFITGAMASLTGDGFTITWGGLTGTAPARTYYYIAFA